MSGLDKSGHSPTPEEVFRSFLGQRNDHDLLSKAQHEEMVQIITKDVTTTIMSDDSAAFVDTGFTKSGFGKRTVGRPLGKKETSSIAKEVLRTLQNFTMPGEFMRQLGHFHEAAGWNPIPWKYDWGQVGNGHGLEQLQDTVIRIQTAKSIPMQQFIDALLVFFLIFRFFDHIPPVLFLPKHG